MTGNHETGTSEQRRLAESKATFGAAAAALRNGGDRKQLADALIELGRAERGLGELESAAAHYDEAADVLRGLDDPLKLAHTVRHAADILLDRGEALFSEARYAEALAIYRRHRDARPLDVANALRGFALAEERLGKTDEARALWEEARALYAASGVQPGVEEAERRLRGLEDSASI